MKICLLLFAAVIYVYADNDQYCQLKSCKGKLHTMCSYDAKNKCSSLIKSGLSQDENDRIVKLHNELRLKIANGQETRGAPGPQSAAKKMETLTWDDEIAKIAQYWAEQCKFSHDKCRNTPKERIGQNIAISATTGDINSITVEKLVQLWYDEVDFFNGELIKKPFASSKGKDGKTVGHYTALVWGDTKKIGCGAVKHFDRKLKKFFLVCNYGPAGNTLGQKIYTAKSS